MVWTRPRSLAATDGILLTSCPITITSDHAGQEVSVCCSLFLWVLRCFTSPGAFHTTYVLSRGYIDFIDMGYPIRKFPDHRLFATSPRLIAGYDVLHQLLATKPSTVRPYVLRPSGNAILKELRDIFHTSQNMTCFRQRMAARCTMLTILNDFMPCTYNILSCYRYNESPHHPVALQSRTVALT